MQRRGGIPSPEKFTLSDNVKHYGEIQVYLPTNFINRKLPHPQIEILRISKAVNQDFFRLVKILKRFSYKFAPHFKQKRLFEPWTQTVVQFIYFLSTIFLIFRRNHLIFTCPSVRFSSAYMYTPQPHFPGRLHPDKPDGRKLLIALTFFYLLNYADLFVTFDPQFKLSRLGCRYSQI